MDRGEQLDELRARARRHPPDRYPVQHATAQLGIGLILSRVGETSEAEQALETAVKLYTGRLDVERARAVNALGAVLRQSGRMKEAVAAFTEARQTLAEAGERLDAAAALYNRGLTRAAAGEVDEAASDLAGAEQELRDEGSSGGGASAARELGAVLVSAGRPHEAVAVLQRALADCHDRESEASVSNVLGLAHLGCSQVDEAMRCFRSSARASPPAVAPGRHAMARANLALALEQAGDRDRATLHALGAADLGGSEPAVVNTARGVLDRVEAAPGTLWPVLDRSWPQETALDDPDSSGLDQPETLLRQEVGRWARARPSERAAESDALVEALVARAARAEELAASWLQAALELPPQATERLLSSVRSSIADHDREAIVERAFQRAMVHFPHPQMLRLEELWRRLGGPGGPDSAPAAGAGR